MPGASVLELGVVVGFALVFGALELYALRLDRLKAEREAEHEAAHAPDAAPEPPPGPGAASV